MGPERIPSGNYSGFDAIAQVYMPRPAHPEGPSIPLLTNQEKAHVAMVIREMILDDLRRLKGPVDRGRIRNAFDALGRESMPQLLEAFDYSCNQGWTCPANILGSKVSNVMSNRKDLDLAEFVAKYAGVGVQNPKARNSPFTERARQNPPNLRGCQSAPRVDQALTALVIRQFPSLSQAA